MPTKDQVYINFGPARYDSQKAIRNSIEDAKREAKEEVINEITNDPDLDLGGGVESAEVIDYIPSTREGTALLEDGTEIEYINSTPTGLAPGDEIIYLTSDIDGDGEDEYIVIGVTDRAGDITPVELPPAAALSANFPLRTDAGVLAFPVNPGVETGLAGDNSANLSGYNFAYDMIGGLGIGSDVIIGPEAAAYTTVNAFVRDTATNVSLFSTTGASTANLSLFCQANGTLIQNPHLGGTAVFFRRPADVSWTSFTATNGNDSTTFEFNSEYAWILSHTTAGVGPIDFLYMSNTDTNFVSAGALGIANDTTVLNRIIVSGNGYLAAIIYGASSGSVYLKSSGDTSSFVLACTFPIASFNPGSGGLFATGINDVRIDALGNISYLISLFSNVHIRYLDTGTGFISDYDTGIPVTYTSGANTRNAIQGHMHTSSGLVLLPGVATDVELGLINAGFYPAMAAFNYVSSTYVYWDEDMGDSMGSATAILSTIPVEVGAGIVRYATRSNTSINAGLPTNTLRHYELSGL